MADDFEKKFLKIAKRIKPFLYNGEKIKYLQHNFKDFFEEYSRLPKDYKTHKEKWPDINYPGIEAYILEPLDDDLINTLKEINKNPNIPAYGTSSGINKKFTTKSGNEIRKTHLVIIPKDFVSKNQKDYENACLEYFRKIPKVLKNYSNSNKKCKERKNNRRNNKLDCNNPYKT